MKKGIYRAKKVNQVNVENLAAKVKGKQISVGNDVGKEICYGALRDEQGEVLIILKWKNPSEARDYVELIKGLPAERLEAVMEPSGTYGDPLRKLLWEAGIEVYRVSAKRSHDAREVYDGVPSSHDAKSAAIVAKLHQDGASELWPFRREYERDLTAAISMMTMLKEQKQENLNRLEALLSRHWPEAGEYLRLGSATLLELLIQVGGPEQVRENETKARKLMRKVGRIFLKGEKIEAVIDSARSTIGVEMTTVEECALKYLAQQTRDFDQAETKATRKVEELSQENLTVQAMSETAGKATAAVLVSKGGDPRDYASVGHWAKSLGMNLKERSSGKHQGQLKITKRGSGMARYWLYFAALRLIQNEEIVRAWYDRKVARDGGIKNKAIVAVMRKLCGALWHIAQGEVFDPNRMYDARRLGIVTV